MHRSQRFAGGNRRVPSRPQHGCRYHGSWTYTAELQVTNTVAGQRPLGPCRVDRAPTAADSLAEAAAGELAIRIANIKGANSRDTGNPPGPALPGAGGLEDHRTGKKRAGGDRPP